jgi:ApaG protein
MVSEITAGIEVSILTQYQDLHSIPEQHHYVFAYKIHINNHNEFPVQLLRRKWYITNGIGETETVSGDGVLGRQPVLYGSDTHEYVSGSHLVTPFGAMRGSYYFVNKMTGLEFEVRIPEFKLEAPFVLN